jgi:hypothetical protein
MTVQFDSRPTITLTDSALWIACAANLPDGGCVAAESWEVTGTAADAVAEFGRRTGIVAELVKVYRGSIGSRPWLIRVRYPNNAIAEIAAACREVARG